MLLCGPHPPEEPGRAQQQAQEPRQRHHHSYGGALEDSPSPPARPLLAGRVWTGLPMLKCDSSDCLLCSAWTASQRQQQQQCSLLRKRSLSGTGTSAAEPASALQAALEAAAAQKGCTPSRTGGGGVCEHHHHHHLLHLHHHQAPPPSSLACAHASDGGPSARWATGSGRGRSHTTTALRDQDGDVVMSEDDDDGDLVKQQDEEQEEQEQHSDDDVHAAVERRRRRQQWWAAQRPPAWRFRPEFQALAGPAPARLHPYAQLLPLQGHQGHTSHDIISALEFSPNGQLLASGSLSKQVRLYSLSELFSSSRCGDVLGEDAWQQWEHAAGACGQACCGAHHPSFHHRHTASWHSSAAAAPPQQQGGLVHDTAALGAGVPGRAGLSHRNSSSTSGGPLHQWPPAGGEQQQQEAPGSSAAAAAALRPLVVHRLPSKVSCLSWSPAHDGVVCVGDYDGVLTQLHVCSGHQLADVDAHAGRRIWGVAHSALQPGLCASVSEDGTAKLWAGAALEQCVAVLRPGSPGASSPSSSPSSAAAALCGVDFSPVQPHLLAVAGADGSVLVYDLRGSRALPLLALHGAHQRPVSYVKFFGHGRLASASTDATLALWDLLGGGTGGEEGQQLLSGGGSGPAAGHCSLPLAQPVQVFRGHRNEKNFVGLSVCPEEGLLACGSETDAVFAFHHAWSDPLASHPVSGGGGGLGGWGDQGGWQQPQPLLPHSASASSTSTLASQPFVSSVAWQGAEARRQLGLPPMLAAGSSTGGIALLTLHAEQQQQQQQHGEAAGGAEDGRAQHER